MLGMYTASEDEGTLRSRHHRNHLRDHGLWPPLQNDPDGSSSDVDSGYQIWLLYVCDSGERHNYKQ